MFAINQKTTTAAKLKETRERRGEGKLETKVERVFRRVYNLPEAYDAARNFNYGQLNGQNFGTVSSQIYPCQLPVTSCQLCPLCLSPCPPNRTWIAKVLQQFIYLHREPFLKPAKPSKPGNLSTKLSSIFNWLAIPKRPSSKSNTHLNPILIGPTPKSSPASLEVGQNLLQSARFLKLLSLFFMFCILCSLLLALP